MYIGPMIECVYTCPVNYMLDDEISCVRHLRLSNHIRVKNVLDDVQVEVRHPFF